MRRGKGRGKRKGREGKGRRWVSSLNSLPKGAFVCAQVSMDGRMNGEKTDKQVDRINDIYLNGIIPLLIKCIEFNFT